jgi:hypothetical protein
MLLKRCSSKGNVCRDYRGSGSIISLSVFVRQRRGGQRIGVRVLDADRFGEDKELILLKRGCLLVGLTLLLEIMFYFLV